MRNQKKWTPSSSGAAQFLYNDVQELLAEIQKRQLILVEEGNTPGHVEIWSPNCKLPLALRCGVYKHRSTLVEMIACNDVRVCPTPQLHKRYHTRDVCVACERLAAATTTTREDYSTMMNTRVVPTSVEVQCPECGRRAWRNPSEKETACSWCAETMQTTGRFMSSVDTADDDSTGRKKSIRARAEEAQVYRILLPS